VRCEVKTPIVGSVESHVVFVGQRVEVGVLLLTVECMKTVIPVEAPCAGTVAWLRPCAETIEVDDVVAVIEVA